MYFDMARVLITSTPLWLLNLRATSWANHHKTDYYAKSCLYDFWISVVSSDSRTTKALQSKQRPKRCLSLCAAPRARLMIVL